MGKSQDWLYRFFFWRVILERVFIIVWIISCWVTGVTTGVITGVVIRVTTRISIEVIVVVIDVSVRLRRRWGERRDWSSGEALEQSHVLRRLLVAA